MTKSEAAAPVTVIGLGPMGQALAEALLNNDHPTTVWNRTPAKADALLAHGAVRADTVAGAAAASPLVIACVTDYAAVYTILNPAADALKGRTLVNLTADSPGRAREMAGWAAARGIDYLDGAIMTPVETIGGRAAMFLYSGSDSAYRAHQSTLASLGGTAVYLGSDPGRAAAHDVALLDIFWTSMSGIVHGFALANAEKITAKELAPLAQGIVGLLPGIINEFATQFDNGDFPGDKSTILSASAGMEHVIHAAQARGLDTSLLGAAQAIAQRAIDGGHGTEGFSRLAEMLGRLPAA